MYILAVIIFRTLELLDDEKEEYAVLVFSQDGDSCR
jgi:hypothetical protein